MAGFFFLRLLSSALELHYRSNRDQGITVDPSDMPSLDLEQGVV